MNRIEVPWEMKCWGKVQHIFYNNNVGISHLQIERGFRCSIHKHHERVNMFCVHTGLLVVEVWDSLADGKLKMELLTPGEVFEVPVDYWHRFRVYRSGIVTEIYYPTEGGNVRFDDIERFDEGGEDNIEELKFTLNELGFES